MVFTNAMPPLLYQRFKITQALRRHPRARGDLIMKCFALSLFFFACVAVAQLFKK
jgi:hypothetical protein